MKMIVAYPVEDENKFTDSKNQVLPDAILIKQGTSVIEFAAKIHTDLAENFVMAIDAKTKKNISKQYIIKNNDVIKIISAKKTKGT
jgi:ribosome-binding ATPase YchF (GTP1/OBG family)